MLKKMFVVFIVVFTIMWFIQPVYAAEATEALTEEEIHAIINDAYSVVLSFWDKFVAGASITSILGAIFVFYLNSKRTEKLTKRNDLLIGAVQALQILTGEMAKEERELKNAVVGIITVANIEGNVKRELLKQVNSGSVDMNKVQETINTLQAANDALDNDEIESILNRDV